MARRVVIEVTGAEELAERLLEIDERIAGDLEPLFAAISDAWVSEFQRIIREQDPPAGPWEELAPWTQRERKKAGYGATSPKLQRTGDLIGRIARQPGSDSEVVVGVGSDLEKAPILHFGGVTALGTVIPARPFIALSEVVIEDTMALVAEHFVPLPGGAADA